MRIMMLLDCTFINKQGVRELKKGKIYEIPDEWGGYLVQRQAGAEYIQMEADR